MIINPIIPIWLMSVICVALLIFKRRGIIPYIRQIIMIILLFVINLRIMVPNGEMEVMTQKLNKHVLFVVDDTISMVAADDGHTERLTKVKEDCAHIIDELYGAKFSVVMFNNEANQIAPFTDNGDYVKSMVNSIYPVEQFYARGTSLNVWKELTLSIIKDIHDNNEGKCAVFFISDGEITGEESLASFKELAPYIDDGAVLGYGTESGGQMSLKSLYDDTTEVVEDRSDYNYKPAISKIDEKNLKKIASDLGVTYQHMDRSQDIDTVVNRIRQGANTETTDKKVEGHDDIYYYFVLPLVMLLIYEVVDTRRRAN